MVTETGRDVPTQDRGMDNIYSNSQVMIERLNRSRDKYLNRQLYDPSDRDSVNQEWQKLYDLITRIERQSKRQLVTMADIEAWESEAKRFWEENASKNKKKILH